MNIPVFRRSSTRRCVHLLLAFLAIAASAVHADEPVVKPPISMSIGIERFSWEEFSGGRSLLNETGPRLTASLTLDGLLSGDLANPYIAEVRGYIGFIDYDGQTDTGVPAKTDVDYIGMSGEIMGGVRLSGISRMVFLGGIGVDTWARDIQDGVAANGLPVLGYQEDYFILYGKLGPGFRFSSGTSNSYLHFGIKYPFYTFEKVYLTTVGYDSDVELEPGRETSWYAKWRMSWGTEGEKSRFGVSVYYDSFRFGASDSKLVTNRGLLKSVHQPESRMDVVGARLEYYF